jgi:SPX domain protein involved in polyphosphate accumulation
MKEFKNIEVFEGILTELKSPEKLDFGVFNNLTSEELLSWMERDEKDFLDQLDMQLIITYAHTNAIKN